MTYQEAHEYIENLQREMTKHRFSYSEELISANGMSILALEKQIQKKPRIEFSPAGLVLSYFCPICGKYFGDRAKDCVILFHTPRYCECGHAILWEE